MINNNVILFVDRFSTERPLTDTTYSTCNCYIELLTPIYIQGIKLTFFTGSHLAPKYFKLVANSKTLVVKIHTSYKEDTRMGHIQRERLPKSKMASSDDRIVHVLGFGNGLNEELCCRFIFTIFNDHWISR